MLGCVTGTVDVTPQLGVAAALVRMSHLVERVFADVARAHGLPPQQLQLLCMLIDGPTGMGELSQLLNLGRSSTTGLVDRVLARRLVTREGDPDDRRVTIVALSDEGQLMARAAHDEVTARLESMLQVLDRVEQDRLAAAHTRVLAEHDPSWVSGR